MSRVVDLAGVRAARDRLRAAARAATPDERARVLAGLADLAHDTTPDELARRPRRGDETMAETPTVTVTVRIPREMMPRIDAAQARLAAAVRVGKVTRSSMLAEVLRLGLDELERAGE